MGTQEKPGRTGVGTAPASWIPSASLLQGPCCLCLRPSSGFQGGASPVTHSCRPRTPRLLGGAPPQGNVQVSGRSTHIPTLTVWENEELS